MGSKERVSQSQAIGPTESRHSCETTSLALTRTQFVIARSEATRQSRSLSSGSFGSEIATLRSQ